MLRLKENDSSSLMQQVISPNTLLYLVSNTMKKKPEDDLYIRHIWYNHVIPCLEHKTTT